MKPSSIVVAVLVLVTVPALVWMLGPGATWVLENVDGVTLNDETPPPATLPHNELSAKDWAAAVATVRGNVLAVATGLAALLAVYYTARNADTARRMFRLSERGHDTDRFSKAVEQVGSGQAPVRLGGLYALEQLGQNNPGLRQTVVDVICAYLRMPWTPPPEVDRQQQIRTAQRAARSRTPVHADARASQDPEEERQVRATAQRLLTDHLRGRKRRWWQRPTAVNSLFWPGVRLDLTGATLRDFRFRNCRVDRADFGGATFSGAAWFDGATFTKDVGFGDATFSGTAWFGEVTFSGTAWFVGATFSNDVGFGGATFSDYAWFGGATFSGTAWFDGATFTSNAWFGGATGLEAALLDGVRLLPIGQTEKRQWPAAWEEVPNRSGGWTLQLVSTLGPHPSLDVESGAAPVVEEEVPEPGPSSADST